MSPLVAETRASGSHRGLQVNPDTLFTIQSSRSRTNCERDLKTTSKQITNPIMKVLAIDTGGKRVKILANGEKIPREFSSGRRLTAKGMVAAVKKLAGDWKYDVISISYPGLVVHGRPVSEPHNLAPGWVGFDFSAAFKCPVKVINDAAMQALGGYKRGRMLFLGLGNSLSSAMIVDGVVVPMELSCLPYKKGTYEDYVGGRGLKKHGKKRWRRHVVDVVQRLSTALEPEDIVLGGANVNKLKKLPPLCRSGESENLFIGGFQLWANAAACRPVKKKTASVVSVKRRTPAKRATN